MNPDGHEKAFEAISKHTSNFQHAKMDTFGRENAAGVDLNRNFPDQFATPEFPDPAPETLEMMNWMEENYFVLSLNLHGGAVVANYPFDNSAKSPGGGRRKRAAKPSVTDDDDVFQACLAIFRYLNNES